MPTISDADAHMSCGRLDGDPASSQHRTNRPPPVRPTADVEAEPQRAPVGDADEAAARERREEPSQSITRDDVSRLAEALRAAKRDHSASLAELRQADAEPVEDWAEWYAEYLLGVR